MKALLIFHRQVRSLLKATEVMVCLLLALLVIVVLWGVFSRYVLGEQSRWTEELAIYLLIWVSLIGAAATYHERGHLGVDYIVQKWDPRTQRVGQFLSHLIVLVFVIYGLLYGGAALVSEAIRSGQVSSAVGLPMAIVYGAVPISGALFGIFAVDQMAGFLTGFHSEDAELSKEAS